MEVNGRDAQGCKQQTGIKDQCFRSTQSPEHAISMQTTVASVLFNDISRVLLQLKMH